MPAEKNMVALKFKENKGGLRLNYKILQWRYAEGERFDAVKSTRKNKSLKDSLGILWDILQVVTVREAPGYVLFN